MNITKYKVYVPNSDREIKNSSLAISNVLFLELANYGLELDSELFLRIAKQKKSKARAFSEEILSEYTMGQLNKPLFDGWEERTSFSFEDRVFNILGYIFQFSGNDFYSESFMDDLKKKVDFSKTKKIKLASDEEFREYFESLIGSNVSLDKKTSNKLQEIFSLFEEDIESLPRIRSAESRIAALLSISAKNGLGAALRQLKCDSLDVLRYAAAKKDFQGFKLPSDVKYAQLSWSERIDIFDFLNEKGEDFESLSEDLGLNRTAWNRFFRHTHFLGQSNFINRFRKLYIAAFVSLGNRLDNANNKITKGLSLLLDNEVIEITAAGTLVYRTFASRLQSAIENKSWKQIKKLCSNKKGYLLRNFTHISNGVSDKDYKDFIEFSKSAIKNVDPNVLFSLLSIDVDAKYRIIDIKGNTVIEEANYNKSIESLQQAIVHEIKSSYGFDGVVDVDSDIKNNAVPFLSKNSELARGTTIKLKDNPFLYFYVNWVQDKERTDLDLSFLFFDSKWKMQMISFRDQANEFIQHSGDFTNAPAPHGATEYGKISLKSIPKDVKYIVPVINVWTGSEFDKNKEVRAGFFLSNNPKFTLSQDAVKYNLTEPAQMNAPFILDVENEKVIVIDFNQRIRLGYGAESYNEGIKKLISATETKNFITIGKLGKMLSGNKKIVSARFTNKPKMDNEFAPETLFSLFSKKKTKV